MHLVLGHQSSLTTAERTPPAFNACAHDYTEFRDLHVAVHFSASFFFACQHVLASSLYCAPQSLQPLPRSLPPAPLRVPTSRAGHAKRPASRSPATTGEYRTSRVRPMQTRCSVFSTPRPRMTSIASRPTTSTPWDAPRSPRVKRPSIAT